MNNRLLLLGMAALISMLLAGCANQQPPGGGEQDTVPPKVQLIFPGDGTVNFSADYFELDFSEYIDKRSFRDAVFISPAPEGTIEPEWSGTGVRVYFEKPLAPGRTYSVSIGTDVVDFNNRNRMAQAFNFAFATGGQIDKGVIAGRVYAEKPSGIMLFAYQVNRDTIDPAVLKPDYISQAGEDGSFRFTGIAPGTYRVFAVMDEFRDLLFQPAQDLIAVPTGDITISASDTLKEGLRFRLNKIDTLVPRMLSAVMTDRYHILAVFTEELDTASVHRERFTILDSAGAYPLAFAARNRGKEKEIVLTTSKPALESDQLFLLARGIVDKAGNTLPVDTVQIAANSKPDTLLPLLSSVRPLAAGSAVPLDSAGFTLQFNKSVAMAQLGNAVTLTDTMKKAVPFALQREDDSRFRLTVTRRLKAQTDYIIRVNHNVITDAAGNRNDTTVTYNFNTRGEFVRTGISGRIINADPAKKLVLLLKSPNSQDAVITGTIAPDGRFSFPNLDPGKYELSCFYDLDGNGAWSAGFPFPFTPAEPFYNFPKIIEAPPRWEVTDVDFDIQK